MSEIHHRVKNNFEIISSLLDMSSMQTENKENHNLWGDARASIHSMALIHNQLYQTVKSYFVNQGINLSRINAVGMGQKNPIGSNETIEGRRQNRRVEIELNFNNT